MTSAGLHLCFYTELRDGRFFLYTVTTYQTILTCFILVRHTNNIKKTTQFRPVWQLKFYSSHFSILTCFGQYRPSSGGTSTLFENYYSLYGPTLQTHIHTYIYIYIYIQHLCCVKCKTLIVILDGIVLSSCYQTNFCFYQFIYNFHSYCNVDGQIVARQRTGKHTRYTLHAQTRYDM
jgi:hypothetical protein